MGDIASNEMYGMNSAAKDFDGINKYIRITDISETSHKFVPNPLTSPEGELDNKYKLQKGDLVFARTGASTGKSYIYDENDGNLYFAGFLIKFHIDNAIPKFIFYNTLKEEYLNWVSVMSVRSGQPGINSNEYKKLPIYLPSFDEQNKVSNFLENVDKKIELLEKKYNSYVDFKQYLMQQIFTQKLRFDFKDKWSTSRLNEIVFFQEGPGVRNYQYTKEGVKLLNVGNFVKNILKLDNTNRYISEDEAYGKYNHFLVDEGDLLIACSGIKAEYFDEKIAFAEKKHLPLCMNTSTMRFKSLDEDIIHLNYLKCYFQSEFFKKQVFSVMTGSAQFNFGPTHLKYFKIPIPSIEEQKKIYELFNSIDNKISIIIQELDKVNEFKKGLLQQMFV